MTETKRGRKPINQELKKSPITVWIKNKDIHTLGGEKQIREHLNQFITTKIQIHEQNNTGRVIQTK